MNLHFILSMRPEVSQTLLRDPFFSNDPLCVCVDRLPWRDRIHHGHLSSFGRCGRGVACQLFWRPLRDVCSSDGEENLSHCVLGAFSVLPVRLVQLNMPSFFLYLKAVFKMLFYS